MVVAAAQFQAEQRFGISLAFIQSTNVVLLLAALVTVVTGVREAWLAVLISTIGWVVAGGLGLDAALSGSGTPSRTDRWSFAIT